MNNNDEKNFELEARVVAWVLGEASAFEAAELERLCAEQPELAVFKRRIEAVHGLMGEAAKPLKTPLLLSPERRAKVLAVIGGAATVETVVAAPVKARKKARSWRSWALPMAACFTILVLLAGVLIPTVGSVKFSAKPKRPIPEQTYLGGDNSSPVFDGSVRSNEIVDNSVYSLNAGVERKGGAVGSRELSVDGYAIGSVSSASGNRSQQMLFDSAKTSPGLQFNESVPTPSVSSAPAEFGGENTQSMDTSMKPVVLGYKVVSDDLYAGPPVALNAASQGLQLTKSLEQLPSGITITAGIPQEFDTIGIPAGSRKLSDSEKARFLQSAGKQPFNKAVIGDLDSSNARLDSVAAEVRRRSELSQNQASDPFAAPASLAVSGSAGLSEEIEQAKLAAKGRSQYFAGDLVGAQETFRTLESVAPESGEAGVFLGRIAKEKSSVAELNRVKNRAQMLQEVSNSWQRPGVSQDTAETSAWTPAILGSKRERDDDSGITITAGTPQKMTIFELTDADRKEIDRRVSKIKRERSTLGVDPKADEQSTQLAASTGGDWDWLLAMNEVIAEIRAAEKKSAETDLAASKPDIKANDSLLESFRSEIPTVTESVSTFSLHVSDASFRLAKAALERGQAPDPATIRPEEFYNAFDYGDPSPAAGEAVSCRIEQAAHPFLQQRNLVRIAMKVPAAGRGAGQPLRLTVLLDTSGSMEREDRAATVRAALTALTSLLGPDDRVTLVGFARTPRLLAESVLGDQAAKLMELAASTPAEGGTNMEEALALAGDLAMRQKLDTAQNRIVLLTDGAANLGDADPQALAKRVEALRQNGIAFDACGVVADGLDDSVLEALTRKGDGRYAVIDSPEEADAGFARKLAGAFRPAAKDVKVQVHFNPARVARYRLIGFEKHRLKTEDFRNDKVDAAELAAEEAAVAVYQVEVLPEGEGELGEVAVRFLDTRSNERVERTWTLGYVAKPAAFDRATPSLQLAGASAFLAEKLRGGALAGQVRLDEFAPVVEGLSAAYPQAPRVQEFIQMFRQTRRLTGE